MESGSILKCDIVLCLSNLFISKTHAKASDRMIGTSLYTFNQSQLLSRSLKSLSY